MIKDALTDHLNKDTREFLSADDLAILRNSWKNVSQRDEVVKEDMKKRLVHQ